MFDARLRRIVAVLAGMALVFLARVFHLQTFEAVDSRARVLDRLNDETPIAPRRGDILDARGRVLARDESCFDLAADARELGAVEWECGKCGRLVTTHERDPGPGAPEAPPLAPEKPDPCRRCGDLWAPTYAVDRLAAAPLLGLREEEFAAALDEARLRSWAIARSRSAKVEGKWHARALRDWLTRPRRVLQDVPRAAAMEIVRAPARYRGLRIETRARRRVNPDLDPATRAIVGRTGPLQAEEWERRREAWEAEGLTEETALDTLFGRSGVEATCDRALRGAFGVRHTARDNLGAVTTREVLLPAMDGADVRLTLDAGLSAEAARILGDRPGALVALDPHTGAVIAAAGVRGEEPYIHLEAVQGLDAGSVLKPYTALVGLEGDLVPQAGEIRCTGKSSTPVRCAHVHGSPGLRDALSESCNPFFGTLAVRIGTGPFARYAEALGLGEPIGIGVPPQSGGTNWTQRLSERLRGVGWERTDLANLGIGQGPVALSTLHVAVLYAAIANGGRPVKPFVVEGAGTAPGAPVFSAESLAAVRAGLEETVRTGTAKGAGLERFRAAGKTGTAQISEKKRSHLYNAWFAAYAPADAPRIVVVVVVENTPESGGTAAAPLVARFLEAWERERAAAPEPR